MFKHQLKKISDPYFDGKIKFTANSRSNSMVIVSLFVVCLMGGTIYYYFPNISQFVEQFSHTIGTDTPPKLATQQILIFLQV